MRFVIEGPPATKKTSQRILRNKRTGTPFLMPSKRSKSWEENAILQLQAQYARMSSMTVESTYDIVRGQPLPMNCAALIYRARDTGDAVGFYQAIADALERAGIVANDRLIVSWDGSRMLVDRARPRVEIELTPAGKE